MLTRNILDQRRQWKRSESRRKALFSDNKTEGKKPYVCLPSSINHLCVNSIFVSVFVLTEQSVSARIHWQEIARALITNGKTKLEFHALPARRPSQVPDAGDARMFYWASWTSSYPYSVYSETTLVSLEGSDQSSPQAVPSSSRRVAGSPHSKSLAYATAFRSIRSVLSSFFLIFHAASVSHPAGRSSVL